MLLLASSPWAAQLIALLLPHFDRRRPSSSDRRRHYGRGLILTAHTTVVTVAVSGGGGGGAEGSSGGKARVVSRVAGGQRGCSAGGRGGGSGGRDRTDVHGSGTGRGPLCVPNDRLVGAFCWWRGASNEGAMHASNQMGRCEKGAGRGEKGGMRRRAGQPTRARARGGRCRWGRGGSGDVLADTEQHANVPLKQWNGMERNGLE